MDTSQKEGSQFPRNKSAPPPIMGSLSIAPVRVSLLPELVRFRGEHAPLTSLSHQLEAAERSGDRAAYAKTRRSYVRQLLRRGGELAELVQVALDGFPEEEDPDVLERVALAFRRAGIEGHADRYFSRAEARLTGKELASLLRRQGILLAQAGRSDRAAEILRKALETAEMSADSRAIAECGEALGTLAFGHHEGSHSGARAFLRAVEARTALGEGNLAFENMLRAFEVDPENPEAMTTLAEHLESRGRRGAAEEVRRDHFRLGTASNRAAYYERRFYAGLNAGEYDVALASALEASLDIELDPERLLTALTSFAEEIEDFEGFLVFLARGTSLGDGPVFLEMLALSIALHRSDFGEALYRRIRDRYVQVFGENPFLASTHVFDVNAARLRHASEGSEASLIELAAAEAAAGRNYEASEHLEPFFHSPQSSLKAAVIGALAAGRARESVARYRSIALLGRVLKGKAGAVYSAVSAENLLNEGLLTEARAAAEQAVHLDAQGSRAIAAQALVALRAPEEAGAEQLETSLSVMVARAETCIVLSRSAQKRGAHRLALTWAARALSLRPGDFRLTGLVLKSLVLAEESDRVPTVVREIFERPVPLDKLSHTLFPALTYLARSSPSDAAELAASACELSAAHPSIVDGAFRLSEGLGNGALFSNLLATQIARHPKAERGPLYLRLAKAFRDQGEDSGAARALLGALRHGAARSEISEILDTLPSSLDADGAIARLQVEVELADVEGKNVAERSRLKFTLGAAFWDAAESPEKAIEAWVEGAELAGDGGFDKLAGILVQVAGAEEAQLRLERYAEGLASDATAARLLGIAARAALSQKNVSEALRLSMAAVRRGPLMTDLLNLVEASSGPSDGDALETAYELFADAALGVYGERAVRYRAARHFDSRGEPERALVHAVSAFKAVPAEGVAFVLMARLSDSTGKPTIAADAIREVAAALKNGEEKERWLEKADALVDPSRAGKRQRAQILLRAAGVRPEEATLRALSDAIGDYLLEDPTAKSELERRFQEVALEAISRADGAYGAMLAIFLADAALLHFDAALLARACLRKAAGNDLEIPDFEHLVSQATKFAVDVEEAKELLRFVKRRVELEGAPMGRGAAELFAIISREVGEPAVGAELLVHAARLDPSDGRLISQARLFAELAGRTDLLDELEELLPMDDRAKALLARLSSLPTEVALADLLALDTAALGAKLRAQVLKEQGERLEAAGRMADARDAYRERLELLPKDTDTLRGLERAAEYEADYEELARLLKLRAEAVTERSDARFLLLRRAVILETQLGRAVEARTLLGELLERDGDSWAVLRVLADSLERASDFGTAAELWQRARKVAPDPDSVADVGFRAARAYFEAGEPKRAREALGFAEIRSAEAVELRLHIERACGEPGDVMVSLVELAQYRRDEPARAGALLEEASKIALSLREYELAERYSRDAVLLRPELHGARLRAAQLRVRREGIADKAAALKLIEEIRPLAGTVDPVEQEICAYLLALSKDAQDGFGAGRAVLEEALKHQGVRPLLAVALAERLSDDPERALALYEGSLGGDLLLMKRVGDVLVTAGDLAKAQGQFARAQNFYSAVDDSDPRRPDAAREIEEIAVLRAKSERAAREKRREDEEADARRQKEEVESRRQAEAFEEARRREEEEARVAEEKRQELERIREEARAQEEADRHRAVEEERARELAALDEARMREEEQRAHLAAEAERVRLVAEEAERTRAEAATRKEAERRAEEARHAAAVAEADALERIREEARAQEDVARHRAVEEEAERARVEESERVEAARLEAERAENLRLREEYIRLEAERMAARNAGEAATFSAPASLEGAFARSAMRLSPVANEHALITALERGDLSAGDELLAAYLAERGRSRDAVVVATHMALLDIARPDRIRAIGLAATKDRNDALALSVEHVLGAYGEGPQVAPPDLNLLAEHPDAVQSLLTRGGRTTTGELLSIVWENSGALFKREITTYGVNGSARIPNNATGPLGELYRSATRFLGIRPALFRGRSGQAISLDIALTPQPSVIVSGDVEGLGPDFAFHFGAMIAAATPDNALLFGLPPERLGALFEALALSFGPAETRPRSSSPDVSKIAAVLWESIPARSQRRLTQLCAEPNALSLPAAADQARRMLRRAGLLVTGDLATAVADVSFEAGVEPPMNFGELAALARRSSLVAELLGLALSPEYAEVRYRTRPAGP